MELVDILILALVAVIVGFAGRYVYKAKKSGKKCIGCPDGCNCGGESTCTGSCGSCGDCKK